MKTKAIPAIIMLLGGASACVLGIINHYELMDYIVTLLIVLVVFFVMGCIVKMILDKNFQAEEATEKEDDSEATEEEKENIESDGENEKSK